MSATDEQIAAALFVRAQAVAGLTTVSRELRAWNDVPDVEQPALFQTTEAVDVTPAAATAGGRSFPGVSRKRRHFTWYLYQHRARLDAGVLLDTAMHDLVAACEAALAPGAGHLAQTLGGLVADCRIAGTIERDGGVLGDQGVAIVPIEVQ